MGGRGVGWVSIIWGVWVARAVPPRTCAHVGSVGALDTPKLCPVGLELAHARSERRTVATQDVNEKTTFEMEAVRVATRINLGRVEKNSLIDVRRDPSHSSRMVEEISAACRASISKFCIGC